MHRRTWPRIAAALAVSTVCVVSIAARNPQWLEAACCYFAAQEKDINQPGQKAFITWSPDEGIESFTVQPKFEGNAIDFGMVIPTPAQPRLDEMPRDFFKDLAIYTILLPLPQPIYFNIYTKEEEGRAAPGMDAATLGANRRGGGHGVKVLESGVVGSLDYKIIVAEQADGLFTWLKEHQYSYSGDESTLDFYIRKKWFFTVMKIDSKQMKKNPDGSYLGEITPTRFTFESKECVYPLKITQISVKDATDALFYVQAPAQMDLQGDWSWMHSWRVMYLTYMLGCGASPEQQKELTQHNAWVAAMKAKDGKFETTKLEWARRLGVGEMSVLDDPLQNYAQGGVGALPPGSSVISLEQFLSEVWADFLKRNPDAASDEYARNQLKSMETTYASTLGTIVKVGATNQFQRSSWMWYPHRQAPAEDVKGLTRLKGHLRPGQVLTKFRKQIRKDEMNDDLHLVPVPESQEQEYVRILPTSPP